MTGPDRMFMAPCREDLARVRAAGLGERMAVAFADVPMGRAPASSREGPARVRAAGSGERMAAVR